MPNSRTWLKLTSSPFNTLSIDKLALYQLYILGIFALILGLVLLDSFFSLERVFQFSFRVFNSDQFNKIHSKTIGPQYLASCICIQKGYKVNTHGFATQPLNSMNENIVVGEEVNGFFLLNFIAWSLAKRESNFVSSSPFQISVFRNSTNMG